MSEQGGGENPHASARDRAMMELSSKPHVLPETPDEARNRQALEHGVKPEDIIDVEVVADNLDPLRRNADTYIETSRAKHDAYMRAAHATGEVNLYGRIGADGEPVYRALGDFSDPVVVTRPNVDHGSRDNPTPSAANSAESDPLSSEEPKVKFKPRPDYQVRLESAQVSSDSSEEAYPEPPKVVLIERKKPEAADSEGKLNGAQPDLTSVPEASSQTPNSKLGAGPLKAKLIGRATGPVVAPPQTPNTAAGPSPKDLAEKLKAKAAAQQAQAAPAQPNPNQQNNGNTAKPIRTKPVRAVLPLDPDSLITFKQKGRLNKANKLPLDPSSLGPSGREALNSVNNYPLTNEYLAGQPIVEFKPVPPKTPEKPNVPTDSAKAPDIKIQEQGVPRRMEWLKDKISASDLGRLTEELKTQNDENPWVESARVLNLDVKRYADSIVRRYESFTGRDRRAFYKDEARRSADVRFHLDMGIPLSRSRRVQYDAYVRQATAAVENLIINRAFIPASNAEYEGVFDQHYETYRSYEIAQEKASAEQTIGRRAAGAFESFADKLKAASGRSRAVEATDADIIDFQEPKAPEYTPPVPRPIPRPETREPIDIILPSRLEAARTGNYSISVRPGQSLQPILRELAIAPQYYDQVIAQSGRILFNSAYVNMGPNGYEIAPGVNGLPEEAVQLFRRIAKNESAR